MSLSKLFWPFPSEKVYCDECDSWRKGAFASCAHENNLGNYKSRKSQKNLACDINKNNDCKWFKKINGHS